MYRPSDKASKVCTLVSSHVGSQYIVPQAKPLRYVPLISSHVGSQYIVPQAKPLRYVPLISIHVGSQCIVPQAKPLRYVPLISSHVGSQSLRLHSLFLFMNYSPGEVLGCTSPSLVVTDGGLPISAIVYERSTEN